MYESIQGETSFTGCMTTFIRLAGCPLRCRWCDSQFSFERGQKLPLSSIIDTVDQFGWRYVCVTGGEPLAQPNVILLLDQLLSKNRVVSLETNGAFSTANVPPLVHIILDVKCPQSGMAEKNDWSNLSRVRRHDEVKFVLADRVDYEWAKEVISKYSLLTKAGNVLLSPVFGELPPKELVKWMVEDKLPARVNLQIHKYIWTPTQRGV